MKNLSLINKLIYAINYLFAIALLLGFVLPYISPKLLPKFAMLSLTVPVLFIVNMLFVIYWLVGLKKQFILSVVCIFIGVFISTPFYKFMKHHNKSKNEVSIMNYNVRLFNAYNWIDDKEIPTKIASFVKTENPDFLCLQEFHPLGENLFDYKYKYIKSKTKKFGQAIFSKYKIVNQGSLDFEHTQNNAIFIDVVKNLDTLRIYNLHLESLGLNPEKENFGQKNSEKLLNRLTKEFAKQYEQVALVKAHQKACNYPMLVSGDFNNTAYSWTYRAVKNTMQDSFLETGSGFGKTFEIKNFPMRIDFIFADKILQINEHKNYIVKYSDHLPIMATIGLD